MRVNVAKEISGKLYESEKETRDKNLWADVGVEDYDPPFKQVSIKRKMPLFEEGKKKRKVKKFHLITRFPAVNIFIFHLMNLPLPLG